MKQSEILDWAMRGIIEEKIQEQNEVRKLELEEMLKELSLLLAVELQKGREQQYLSFWRKSGLEALLGGLKRMV